MGGQLPCLCLRGGVEWGFEVVDVGRALLGFWPVSVQLKRETWRCVVYRGRWLGNKYYSRGLSGYPRLWSHSHDIARVADTSNTSQNDTSKYNQAYILQVKCT